MGRTETGVIRTLGNWGDIPWTNESREEYFARVAEETAPRLYRTAFALLGNGADAEDVVQEALLKGYKALTGFRGEAEAATWLYRITVNLCHDAGRKKVSHQSLLSRLAVFHREADSGPPPDEAAERSETGRELMRLLKTLDEKYRVPLALKHVAGRSIKEIAAALNLPEGTIKRRLYDAYTKLRAEMTKGGGAK